VPQSGQTRSPSLAPSFQWIDQVPGRLVVLRGRLDVGAAADARLALADAVRGGVGELVVDVSGLEAVDATGLGVLVGAHRHAGRALRSLVLLDVPPQVSRLLLLTRLHRVLRTATSAALA
jgi:anti-anti-sigma factor